ncbi:MAG TPA: hypothetical protein VLV16_03730 [Gemmatimonadales bacterium]|nr:hypothetical protein [Gemmatimonadales bacterium]
MRQFRRYPSVLRLVAAMLLAVPLSACTHWVALSDPKYISDSDHSMFRLSVTGERTKVIVKHPKIEGDSLVWDHHGRQTLPMKKINYAEAHQIDPVATGFLGIATALFITAFILVNESGTSIGL